MRTAAVAIALASAIDARADDGSNKNIVLASAIDARADDGSNKNIVLADLGLHVVGVGYERVLSGGVAVQADAESYVPWTEEASATALFGVALRTRLFFHPFGHAPNGAWISPVGTWGYGRYAYQGVERGGPLWSVGASIGYAVTLVHHLHVLLGAGVQYNAAAFGLMHPPSYAQFLPHARRSNTIKARRRRALVAISPPRLCCPGL